MGLKVVDQRLFHITSHALFIWQEKLVARALLFPKLDWQWHHITKLLLNKKEGGGSDVVFKLILSKYFNKQHSDH